MATPLRIISKTNMVKPEEVCSLHRAVKASSVDRTHSVKG